MTGQIAACRIEVRGVVQGVGFRPFVYRLAHEHVIKGWVLNDTRGVTIHAEGTPPRLQAFIVALRERPPAAATIHSLKTATAQLEGCSEFQIRSSEAAQNPTTKISPDLPVCEACLAELGDHGSRRFQYPYINCTACGPRYSIIKSLPYDRAHTTMSSWKLCNQCQAEYDNPLDRRHHAQPTACNQCGPNYRLVAGGEELGEGVAAISKAAHLLCNGKIVAVKGIGGFHLACEARDELAVRRLRERKFRKEKPFAVMVRDLEEAHQLVELGDLHIRLLSDVARPIVLAPSKEEFPSVAPDTRELGLMLPYAPLHQLLFKFGAPSPLVLTSANRSSEPIAYEDQDALERLSGIADAFLIGQRPIARRVDDSVVAVRNGQPAMLRRSRGFTPGVVARVYRGRPILALGADLKNTIALAVDGEVMVSQFIGDLGDLETDRAFEQTVRDLLQMYGLPEADLLVVHDLHPEYVSTRFARSLDCHRRVAVQHHRAHIASVLAERHELDRPVVGIALDGTGYGDDKTIWGCEVFVGSLGDGLERVAHLPPVAMPGGDAAARHPVQAAAGFLAPLELPDLTQPPFELPQRFYQSLQLVANNVRCFTTSSAGRLFDTVAALCGFTREVSYEGQAAIWLEHQAAEPSQGELYSFPELNHKLLLAAIIADRLSGRDVAEISYIFHVSLASSLLQVAQRVAKQYEVSDVVLSGGVFQNRLLRALMVSQSSVGLNLIFNETVPTNDGGISLGQAAIASVAIN